MIRIMIRTVGSTARQSCRPSISALCERHTARSVRWFSRSTTRKLKTSELQDSYLSSLRCNADRLWNDIHSSAQFGTGPRYSRDGVPAELSTGLSRLSLSHADMQARDWFAATLRAVNPAIKITIDSIGNQFAIRPGLDNELPAVFVGSHLDSQPLGGRFDGVLGVCAGIETLRVLDENWIETRAPVGVVNWCNEEGARFPRSMMGSGVWAGTLDIEDTYELNEVGGQISQPATVLDELLRHRVDRSVPAHHQDGVLVGAHFELHIEQGPILEHEKKHIGIVEGVQAYKWFDITVHGRSTHTGTTPMAHRQDPVIFASRLVLEARRLAIQHGVLASVGVMRASPGSVNTVADSVLMSLDVRAGSNDALSLYLEKLRYQIDQLANDSESGDWQRVIYKLHETFSSPAVKFHPDAIRCVEESTRSITGQEGRKMTSGAGHDSVNTSKHAPTAMVFVPCRHGVSHHPEEWCEKEDCARGTNVIIQAVLRFDRYKTGNNKLGLSDTTIT